MFAAAVAAVAVVAVADFGGLFVFFEEISFRLTLRSSATAGGLWCSPSPVGSGHLTGIKRLVATRPNLIFQLSSPSAQEGKPNFA